MTKLSHVVRIILGLAFVFFGLNGFFHFMPVPPPTGDAATVFTGLAADRFLFPTMFGLMTISGALLLAGRFVPLALVFMAPVLVNIVIFHLSVDPGGIVLGAVLTVLVVFLAWSYRDAFKPMLAAKQAFAGRPIRLLQPELPSLKRSTRPAAGQPPGPGEPPRPVIHVQ